MPAISGSLSEFGEGWGGVSSEQYCHDYFGAMSVCGNYRGLR